MVIHFVTSNEGKVREARDYLESVVPVEQVEYAYTEIQHDDLEAITVSGAAEALNALDVEAVLVGDSGLFIDALDGFPGPYSAYVESTLGIERVWDLVRAESNRRGRFRTVLGYADDRGVETFAGEVAGTIVAPRGSGGFGYDPIFEYNGETFAEVSTEEKNAVSHRGRALTAFREWFADTRVE